MNENGQDKLVGEKNREGTPHTNVYSDIKYDVMIVILNVFLHRIA